MMTNSKAIVLNTLKYGETKIFVNVYSREYGMITLSCSSARKKKGNSKLNCLQPLNIVEAEFEMKPKADIFPLREVRIDYPAASIAYDPYKLSISIFLAEFLRYALKNEQKNYMLYDYITQSIEWLDAAEKHFSNFHLIFMVKLAKFIGFYPDIESFRQGSAFDLCNGTFSDLPGVQSDLLKASDSELVLTLDRLSFASMHLLKLTREQRNECTEMILKYYRYHLPTFPRLKSFAILQELFV
jgi:DNA repair protein RecO (recombination protein O)